MNKIHCPYQYQYQLANWAYKYFNKSTSKFFTMKKKQLYAIWCRVQQSKKVKYYE